MDSIAPCASCRVRPATRQLASACLCSQCFLGYIDTQQAIRLWQRLLRQAIDPALTLLMDYDTCPANDLADGWPAYRWEGFGTILPPELAPTLQEVGASFTEYGIVSEDGERVQTALLVLFEQRIYHETTPLYARRSWRPWPNSAVTSIEPVQLGTLRKDIERLQRTIAIFDSKKPPRRRGPKPGYSWYTPEQRETLVREWTRLRDAGYTQRQIRDEVQRMAEEDPSLNLLVGLHGVALKTVNRWEEDLGQVEK